MAKDSLLFRDSKNIPVHLILTGKVDQIACVCGAKSDIPYHLDKKKKTNIVLAFTKEHKDCKR